MSTTPPRKPTHETFTAKVKRWFRQFDAWVERQVGKLEPEGRRRLAIGMSVCMTVSVAIGGVVYLVMQRNGTLTEHENPFLTGVGIAACFGYVTFKALTYKEPPLTPQQQRQRELRRAWKQERSLDDPKPWPQFMAWAESRGTEVAVLIVRRDSDDTFHTELFDTIAGESTAEDGAELMWYARDHAEQTEVDAIAEYEITQVSQREVIAARLDEDKRQRDAAEVAEKAARHTAALAAAEARDRRTDAEGLAAAMRHTVRIRR